ncbi:hypothetical protein BDU57DRAFT_509387 [Ampelomyces quisqualis]|uniref:Uncharacterized protein n=1 Tax=Ampelomyces quisqualis TaxID=50730 RepID=A0A6A5QYM0_AMPQU|nr:hypothetical protein BDU57DRAFT_509387 [Ampelomyces quisqualis]
MHVSKQMDCVSWLMAVGLSRSVMFLLPCVLELQMLTYYAHSLDCKMSGLEL